MDCSILLKFGTELHHITGNTPETLKVNGQRSRSQHKVRYQQHKLRQHEIR